MFPIVGIGASAGGLEAFRRLLKALPADTGMGFVLVQHLDPDHESMLTRLISNATTMPVSEVQEGMPVQPNHVYVIPPNTVMEIRAGVLHLVPRVEAAFRHMPIDHFLKSLAENESSRAIGVILSGSASDGTLGLKAVKGEGGITFAQDEKTAKYDGMPRSAIAAGCVDFVLPPEGIARELARLGRHPYVGVAPPAAKEPAAGDDELRKIFALLRTATGIDFTYYKHNTIKRRIARRMVLQKTESVPEYVKYLRANRAELNALYEDILIHVTTFFREPEVFHILKEAIFPKIVQGKSGNEPVRIWVPGCSTGEEPYSLAMVLLEVIGDRTPLPPIQIFGTDISEAALGKARAGIYSVSGVADVSPERLRRFFVRCDGGYQVVKSVREMCIFARQDLIKDPPFSRLDLLSCRNVLIYMGPVLQKIATGIFHYALKPSGYLVLGKSESISGFSELFTPVAGKHRIYSKKSTATRAVFNLPSAPLEPILPEDVSNHAAPARFDLQKEADRIVVNQVAPPGLVADEHLQILHFRGNVAPFLSPSPGEASLSLPKMVRPEFAVELRTAIHRARKQETPIRKEGIVHRRNGSLFTVNLEVIPFKGEAEERYFLVLFQEERVQEASAGKSAGAQVKLNRSQEQAAARLRRELQTTKDYLQSIIEEQEATNEELKSANEEILSSNEELQSTNEELETAKEELQSTNEELVTVNEQLQNRNVELGQLTDDLANLLSGVNIPIVMLGNDRRIRRFTPLAERLLNLLPTDVGRPIDNIRPNVKVPDLESLITQVIDTVTPKDREIQDADGKWYSMRLRPYRTVDNKIDGVVMIFIDVDELKVTQDALREQNVVSAAVLASTGALVMVTDLEGRIVAFNRACETSSGYKFADLKGRFVWDELLVPGEGEQVRAVHRKILTGGSPIQDDSHWVTRDGAEKFIAWSSTVMPDAQGSPRYVVRIGTDITERHRAETSLQASEAALRRSREQLQSLAAGLISTQEEERKRLFREMHDLVGGRLARLAAENQAVARTVDGQAQERLRGVSNKLSGLSEDIRRMAMELHPATLDHDGLGTALKSYCADFTRQEGIQVRFTARGLPKQLPLAVTLAVYRVAQEALRNVAQHSSARSAAVLLGASPDALKLTIVDQGRGFDPARLRKRGLGLIKMEERMRMVGGSFEVKAKPGQGVRIDARIPLSVRRRNPKRS